MLRVGATKSPYYIFKNYVTLRSFSHNLHYAHRNALLVTSSGDSYTLSKPKQKTFLTKAQAVASMPFMVYGLTLLRKFFT